MSAAELPVAAGPGADPALPGGASSAADPARRSVRFLLPLGLAAIVLAGWQIAAANGTLSAIVLPAPTAILLEFVHSGPELAANAATTAIEALSGFAIGNILGFLLAVLFIHSELSRRAVYPLAMGANAIPVVAVSPALILWLGNGMAPKIAVASFLVLFPMLINGLRGLRSADAEVEELLFTLKASAWQRLIMIRIPAALPFIFSALKVSACACFVAAIVGEWIAADRGLGYLIVYAGSLFQLPKVWAAILLGTLSSMAVYGAVAVVERLSMPWLAARSLPPE